MGANAAGLGASHQGIEAVRRAGFQRIVLAYDGSVSSRQGLTWVPHLLAQVPGVRATILHIHDPNEKPRSALARQMTLDDLDELVRALAAHGVDARPLIVAGDPARELPRALVQLHADLLVSGSRGRGPFGRKIMGSVADSLVRHTDANLLVARTGGPPAHVLLATDGTPSSVQACRFGAQLAQRWAAPVTLLRVGASDETFPPELAADILPRHADGFDTVALPGDPAAAILATAARVKAGAVIMSRHDEAHRDALVSATAARIAREAPASVLLVRRPPA